MVAHVVKRAGHTEPYQEAKVQSSLHHAALSVRALEGEAELLAAHVGRGVSQWIEDKVEVTSLDIRNAASRLAGEFHPKPPTRTIHTIHIFKNLFFGDSQFTVA